MINKAEASAPISAARLVFTTYDELFGRVQFILKSIVVIIGITATLVGAVFRYQNQFEQNSIIPSIRIAQWMVLVLPFYASPVELQEITGPECYLYIGNVLRSVSLSLTVFIMFLVNSSYLALSDARYQKRYTLVPLVAAIAVLVGVVIASELPIVTGPGSATKISVIVITCVVCVAVVALIAW